MSLFPSLFFCVDVQHAFDLSAILRGNGIRVYPVSGKTPDDEELRLYRMFKDGEIDGMASAGVLNEGADHPNAIGAFLTRPTKSGLLYRQQVGRVTRPFPAPTGPRPYQRTALSHILADARSGTNLQLIVMATGSGKTAIAAHLPVVVRHWKGRPMKRLMFLVHRDNLVQQAAEAFRRWQPNLTVGVEAGGGRCAGNSQIVIGSVQAIGNASVDGPDGEEVWTYSKRLTQFNPDDFDVIVVDESHHSVKGKQYQAILRYFMMLKGDPELDREKLLVCLTATPNRADNIGMELIVDKITFEYPMTEGIKSGFIADVRGYRCETTVDISAVRTTAGDLNSADLGSVINTPERNELVAREYLRIRELIRPDIESSVGRKPYCVVVDFVDVSGRHELITSPSLFGLREKFDLQGRSGVDVAEEVDSIESENPGLDTSQDMSLEAIKRRAESMRTSLHALNLLAPPMSPPELKGLSKMLWLKESEGNYRLTGMDGKMVSVRRNTLGGCDVFRHWKGVRAMVTTVQSTSGDALAAAIKIADLEIPEGERRVLSAGASWRKLPPTEKQVGALYAKDRKVRKEFKTMTAFYDFCVAQYESGNVSCSRGGISDRLN